VRLRTKLIISIILLIIPVYFSTVNIIFLILFYNSVASLYSSFFIQYFPSFSDFSSILTIITYISYVHYALPTVFLMWICPFGNSKLIRYFFISDEQKLPIDVSQDEKAISNKEELQYLTFSQKLGSENDIGIVARDRLEEEDDNSSQNKNEVHSREIVISRNNFYQLFLHFFYKFQEFLVKTLRFFISPLVFFLKTLKVFNVPSFSYLFIKNFNFKFEGAE